MQQYDFDRDFFKAYEEKSPKFDECLNIAIIGKVSAGKSSLLNAFFERDRSNPLAKVGARSGVTEKVTPYKLNDDVLIFDCPGLDDVRAENSEETTRFLSKVDLGLFIVTGSADESQKSNYDDLEKSCKKVFVVLNKIDEWDDLEDEARETVVNQWKQVLGVNKIYETCTKGYDPQMRKDCPLSVRGVEELKQDVMSFLTEEKKALKLQRHLKNREGYATGIISTALLAVAGEAFIPGSAVYITATQVVAITSLNYLYTGQVLSKASALALLPEFVGQSMGMTAFLWAKSFLPPTGVLDVAAAGIAVVITFAMLATVKWILENGHRLDESDLIGEVFSSFKSIASELKNLSFDDFKNKQKIYDLIARLLTKGNQKINVAETV